MGDMMAMANAIFPFILMGAIFYFMLWRPQKKEKERREKLLSSLKKGDKIITIGGLYGTLTSVGEQKVSIQIADGVICDYSKSCVAGFQDTEKQARTEQGQ